MCTWPRIWLLTQAFTIVAAVTLAMALCASGATARTVAVAAATFCVVRLAWYCWLNRSSGMSAERVPGMGSPGRGNKILTDEQVEFFDRAGYLILPQVVAAEEATKFAESVIFPGLAAKGVDRFDPTGWHTGEKWQIILPGWCRGGRNVANHNHKGAMVGGAVPDEHQNYRPLFESQVLTGALDDLHGLDRSSSGGSNVDEGESATSGSKVSIGKIERGRRWEWLGHGKLGHCHVRYPLVRRQPWLYPASPGACTDHRSDMRALIL